MTETQFVVTIFFGILLILLPIVDLLKQVILWNRGICENNDKPWELYDIDKRGNRLYKSEHHFVWIKYQWIDI